MSEGNKPKFSVIIPHYEMQEVLSNAVDSVVEQDVDSIELIIVDDGSENGLPVNGITEIDSEIHMKIIEQAHTAKPGAVNRGLKEAKGEYIAILDADDQLPPNSLSKRFEKLKEDDTELCIGEFQVAYNGDIQAKRSVQNYKGKSRSALTRDLLTKVISPLHQNAMMFRRDLLDKVGGMSPEMVRCQDKDFAIRLIKQAENISLLAEPVYIYNKYDRPFKKRIKNRWIGMKYHLKLTSRFTDGWRKLRDLAKVTIIESAKMVHDLFGVYKK